DPGRTCQARAVVDAHHAVAAGTPQAGSAKGQGAVDLIADLEQTVENGCAVGQVDSVIGAAGVAAHLRGFAITLACEFDSSASSGLLVQFPTGRFSTCADRCISLTAV